MAPPPTDIADLGHSDLGHSDFGRPDLGDAPAPSFAERVAGKLVVITGGGGLLGGALARELGQRGADIALMGHDPDELDEVVSSLAPGTKALTLRSDLASESDVAGAVQFLEHLDRPVDLLIHGAGLQTPSTIAWSSVRGLDEHYLWNVRGPYLLTQKLLPLLSVRAGRVVFFMAPSPQDGGGGDVHHRISSAGLESFARELRIEADKMGIHVLTVNAFVKTWTDVSEAAGGPGGESLLSSFARAVSQAILADSVDVTDLTVKVPSGTRRVFQS
ncbi:MAG TPA: SDR family oxidoreductase [Microthrixaceae bacterium]|nr:SDR family oxidoreductase [Microthrixaceae bacterium]